MSVKRYQPVAQCVEPSYQAQMIEPKVMEFSEGEYVLHSDYARLKAEVERLIYVGDMLATMVGHCEVTGDAHRMMLELSGEWKAAKEGKQS